MTGAASDPGSPIAWAWAGRALELESGDLHVVTEFPGGALVGLVDGLGHGAAAAAAARCAAQELEAHASEAMLPLIQRCHAALRGTRGAAMSLAVFRTADSSMTWAGIGNVEAVVLRRDDGPREAVTLRGGVVGYSMPAPRVTTVSVASGDTLIMATDGIRSGFTSGLVTTDSPEQLAESILARFDRRTDDARVVVARYVGAPR